MNLQDMWFLEKKKPKIAMFCGKGGVGKTTSSSATAIHFALNSYRTLLISTDPAPSLSDILEVDVGGEITPLESVPGLYAVELNYDKIVELWKEKYGDEVYEVATSFLPVEEEIIDYIAGAPGIDQEFALSYVYDLYTSGEYDIIIWDTAPSGGTLALLNLQDTFYKHLGEAARLYVRVRSALKALTHGRAKRDPLKIIETWQELAQNVLDMVRSEETQALVVTIPEALPINQTKRVVFDLEKFGIQITGIVVNRVLTPEAADSAFNRNRRRMQQKYLGELKKIFGQKLPLVPIPLMNSEVKGVEALIRVEKKLFPT